MRQVISLGSFLGSGAYENKLKEARDIAMEEMKQLATQKGANA
ncbi:hypothetical protein COI61_25110, partial [Bacillus cereus]